MIKITYNVVQFTNGNYGVQKTKKFFLSSPIVKYYDFRANADLWFGKESMFFKDCQTTSKEKAMSVYDVLNGSSELGVKIIK